MGANARHLSLRLRDGAGRWLRAVWWGEGSRAMALATGMRVDLAAELKINDFNGRVNVEAEVKDVRIRER
ncbi:MAG TPA: hypothetical protein VG711_11275, partial [Phycisphaerales bacterium]|nr:hypothetical protein [Phycisphaerales bacterium]